VRRAARLGLAECVTTNWNTLFRVCLPGFVAVLFCDVLFCDVLFCDVLFCDVLFLRTYALFLKTSVVYAVVASGRRAHAFAVWVPLPLGACQGCESRQMSCL
jgi:hypothetical protein